MGAEYEYPENVQLHPQRVAKERAGQLLELERENSALRASLKGALAERDALEAMLAEMTRSSSWRLTRPMRILGSFRRRRK